MIDTKKFVDLLIKKKIHFFSGVPDSCTNNFCNELSKRKKIQNFVVPNEGTGVSLGIGYYLSTKKIPLVYLQNSGLGNATDPITNLISKHVYNIPLILLIGRRGAPGIKDENQHVILGKNLINLLKQYEIKYLKINSDKDLPKVAKLLTNVKKKSLRVAIIINPGTFSSVVKKNTNKHKISRYEFLETLLKIVKKNSKLITSVGYNSRELFYLRQNLKNSKGKDFLVVGGMGHTFPIALSHQEQNRQNTTICIDGDGSFYMHLGNFALLKNFKQKKLKYILLDNNSHESIGGQEINFKLDVEKFSKAAGFKNFYLLENLKKISNTIKKFLNSSGSSFLHVKIKEGSIIKKLPRPKNFKKILINFK